MGVYKITSLPLKITCNAYNIYSIYSFNGEPRSREVSAMTQHKCQGGL